MIPVSFAYVVRAHLRPNFHVPIPCITKTMPGAHHEFSISLDAARPWKRARPHAGGPKQESQPLNPPVTA
ncbi:hypothetical protein M404DRAFT_1004310 [Pisolithus tinctorius Marx 270]|uniref:Uncharacterized protein n=1 Tax=Pisolithus tinctorius Marx 270 TaxID=870435 RepID=A0A0C3ISV4_PISTI|nr:hypothetical protein M404DRAFT_1004310 [Pisolithus tinctorius Marx 270]